jgi:hypothetical protein
LQDILTWHTTLSLKTIEGFQGFSQDFESWTIGIGQTDRIVFSAEDYTNMSYYNCSGIRPKHSNISKRVGEGVFTICMVLDQSTVIFKKKGGEGYNLCGIEIKICVVFSRKNNSVSLPNANGPTSIYILCRKSVKNKLQKLKQVVK